MDKVFEVQRQVRENTKVLHSYMTDLQNWESEMKRKEAALNGVLEQDLPPIRSKIKKEKPVLVKKKPEKRIPSSDYKAWDKFDVDKACEEVDMSEVGPASLDGKKSQEIKEAKLREEALFEKERGNNFVKAEKWDEAIKCYNRAIELVKDDAIYYANRGLCYLKKDSLHQAESDCSEALRLDPTYVKALQRRALARERLGSLRAASRDLADVLRLEPRNNAARAQLSAIKDRMGTKGSKSKSSPSPSPLSTPVVESKLLPSPKIVELPDEAASPVLTRDEQWMLGKGEGVTVIKTVKKPPHLRSKRALKHIPILEIPLGKSAPEKPPTRLKIIEMEDEKDRGDSNIINSDRIENAANIDTKGEGDKKIDNCGDTQIDNNGDMKIDSRGDINIKNNGDMKIDNHGGMKIDNRGDINFKNNGDIKIDKHGVMKIDNRGDMKIEHHGDMKIDKVEKLSPGAEKAASDSLASEKVDRLEKLTPPATSVQFMLEWKNLSGNDLAKARYLSIIDPAKIPSIFCNALESEVLSEFLVLLSAQPGAFSQHGVAAYLKAFCAVKRFAALAMFLSAKDKQLLTTLLAHCKAAENCSDADIADLNNKYEL